MTSNNGNHPDLTRAQTILDWRAETSLEAGLAKTIDFFRAKSS